MLSLLDIQKFHVRQEKLRREEAVRCEKVMRPRSSTPTRHSICGVAAWQSTAVALPQSSAFPACGAPQRCSLHSIARGSRGFSRYMSKIRI